jgi:hypothetical protein
MNTEDAKKEYMHDKVYVSYSCPEDAYALDMIKGKLLFNSDKLVVFITHSHRIRECSKALILISEESDSAKLAADFRKLKMTKIPLYVTKIHNNQNPVIPEELSDIIIRDWSLDYIMEFCCQ